MVVVAESNRLDYDTQAPLIYKAGGIKMITADDLDVFVNELLEETTQ